jgi:hypothetical protein
MINRGVASGPAGAGKSPAGKTPVPARH